MAGYFTITTTAPSFTAFGPKLVLPAPPSHWNFFLKSYDGYKKKVTVTFWLTCDQMPFPTVSPTSIMVSLDEDELEILTATVSGGVSGAHVTLYADATDGTLSDSASVQFDI
jgi:hypothetical protein